MESLCLVTVLTQRLRSVNVLPDKVWWLWPWQWEGFIQLLTISRTIAEYVVLKPSGWNPPAYKGIFREERRALSISASGNHSSEVQLIKPRPLDTSLPFRWKGFGFKAGHGSWLYSDSFLKKCECEREILSLGV